MPLTFEQAKLQLNSDPDWTPKKNSPEFAEILKIMVMSGFQMPGDSHVPRKFTVSDIFAGKVLHNPLNRPPLQVIPVRKVSKKEFMTIQSNREYIEEHIKRNRK